MKDPFSPKTIPYDLCNNNSFQRRGVNVVWYGTELASYIDPKIWDLVPSQIEFSGTLNAFKSKNKIWVPEGCPCRVCRVYPGYVGFISKKLSFKEEKLKYYHYYPIFIFRS